MATDSRPSDEGEKQGQPELRPQHNRASGEGESPQAHADEFLNRPRLPLQHERQQQQRLHSWLRRKQAERRVLAKNIAAGPADATPYANGSRPKPQAETA